MPEGGEYSQPPSHRITSWAQPGGWVGAHRRFYGLAVSPKGSSLGWFLRHKKKNSVLRIRVLEVFPVEITS